MSTGLEAVSQIRRIAGERYVGPAQTFSELHVLKAMMLLGEEGLIGRGLLAAKVRLGQGAVRTLIKRLRSGRLIKVGRDGCSLTKKGLEVYRQVIRMAPKVIEFDAGVLSPGKYSSAALLKSAANRVKRGLEQRDAAIRAGAEGATTLIYRRSKFSIPGDTDNCERDYPSDVWRRLIETLKPESGDVILLAGGSSSAAAEYGALAAAWSMLV